MFVEKIKTPGLAHLSYIIGAEGQAIVIDPRLDCEFILKKQRHKAVASAISLKPIAMKIWSPDRRLWLN